ncbi:protein ENL isoform X2 [Drosophila willistoni]|uniref:protein ENL isoform X2 n=1 Tax=Drosophila willistoni TaxID=7260 RepID=UPI000C26DAB0|nr:protein ENL isoform X2 [Drosophila willistoni]
MKVCVLYLSIFTLLQLQCKFVQSTDELWLPRLDKFSAILSECESKYRAPQFARPRPLGNLPPKGKISMSSSANAREDEVIKALSNIKFNSGAVQADVSNGLDLTAGKNRKLIDSARNDQSSISSSLNIDLSGKRIDRKNPIRSRTPRKPLKSRKPIVIKPRTRAERGGSPISISIGDTNANNQVVMAAPPTPPPPPPPPPPPINNIVTINNSNTNADKPQPRTLNNFKLPPAERKERLYIKIAGCVQERLLALYRKTSS